MKPAKERGFAASSLLPRRRAARYRSLLLAVMCVSSFVSVSSAPRAGRHKKPEAEADSPLESSGGLHEYRKVGMQLIGLWREYTAMSDALSHALHDFNVVVRQEQRVELARVLSRKHRQAEVTLAAEKALGRGVPPDVVYGEVASLKELKKQMKRLDRKVGEIPDYRLTEKNLLMIQGLTVPVNLAKALSRPSAALFRKSLEAYHSHIHLFNNKYIPLREFTREMKTHLNGEDRHTLIRQAAEHGNFFETNSPVSLHYSGK